ncbi:MAG: Maf family protein [Pseudomonadota bacterium]
MIGACCGGVKAAAARAIPVNASPPLILASGSRYRRELLQRIVGEFAVTAVNIDESRQGHESAAAMAARLAASKAAAAGTQAGIVIGSDQTALVGTSILGKPGNAPNAARQLARCSSQTVVFYTAVALRGQDAAGATITDDHLNITSVRFRALSPALIERYVACDQPFDCAGGFKAEAAGPVLFESITSTDPTGLVGLPLCWLAGALSRHGVELLADR